MLIYLESVYFRNISCRQMSENYQISVSRILKSSLAMTMDLYSYVLRIPNKRKWTIFTPNSNEIELIIDET